MICELCGGSAIDGFVVRIEGGKVTACPACAKSKEVVSRITSEKNVKAASSPKNTENKTFDVGGEYDFVEGFGTMIKNAREKRGWSQQDLGREVNESHSTIHRMEQGKYEPTVEAARKIEHKLSVKILERSQDIDENVKQTESKELTLGDLVVVRKKG